MRMSVGPNQGQKKRGRRRPTVRRKACTVKAQGSRSSNSQSNPCNCASGSSAGGSRTPTWENWTGRDHRPSSPFAQEDESRPFQLTGRTALQIISFQRATTWPAMAQGTGHVSTKNVRPVGAYIGDGLTQNGVLWPSQPSPLILWPSLTTWLP